MGQKTHPKGFRLVVTKDWQSVWYASDRMAEYLQEDEKIRSYLNETVGRAGIDELKISRSINDVQVDIKVARPGLVIGRGGAMIEEIRKHLDGIVGGRLRLNVQEVSRQDLSPVLAAENLVGSIERRYPYKRAITGIIRRVMDSGAKGVKIFISGRLGGSRIARAEKHYEGSVPTSTLDENVRYAQRFARTKYGTVGVKIWITQPDEDK